MTKEKSQESKEWRILVAKRVAFWALVAIILGVWVLPWLG